MHGATAAVAAVLHAVSTKSSACSTTTVPDRASMVSGHVYLFARYDVCISSKIKMFPRLLVVRICHQKNMSFDLTKAWASTW